MLPPKPRKDSQAGQTATQRNIATICAMEEESLNARSVLERLGDAIAVQAGRPWFIIAHLAWFTGWMIFNAHTVVAKPFDPYPYSLLTMIVSLEAIFLSLFLLMSQNRSNRQAEQRAHLDLQINLLSETENTKMLQMLQALCAHQGLAVAKDPEVEELAGTVKPTDILA